MHETYDNEIGGKPGHRLHPRLGIIGGGQLARMTTLAAANLGIDVVVLERNGHSPAASVAALTLAGDWDSELKLEEFAGMVDVVTLENEFVSPASLAVLERMGVPVRPGSACLGLIQDKFAQKETLRKAGLGVAEFAAVETRDDLGLFATRQGWPVVLKSRRNGYDGKGNYTVRTPADVDAAWQALHRGAGSLYVEAFCPFESELATIVTRGTRGELAAYPVVETRQDNHICATVLVPASVPAEIAREASRMAQRALEAVGAVGSFGIELFLLKDGTLLINELAPRVHNSGHYTQDACVCSQFENHVRAVMGLPLGSTALRAPAAVMINLLGDSKEPAVVQGLDRALEVPDAHVHLYGKWMSGPRRKLGHVNALGSSADEAMHRATTAASFIRFGTKP